jgi:serine/threonine-protein kinase
VWSGGVSAVLADEGALAILKKNCEKCHGNAKQKAKGLKIGDRATWIAPRGGGETPFFNATKWADSAIWQQIDEDLMPPAGPLSDDDKKIIQQWLEAGAKFDGADPVPDKPAAPEKPAAPAKPADSDKPAKTEPKPETPAKPETPTTDDKPSTSKPSETKKPEPEKVALAPSTSLPAPNATFDVAAIAETGPKLAEKAFTILRARCDQCHGAVNQNFPGLEVLNREKLVTDRGPGKSFFVIEGKPDESMIFQVVRSNRMPPGRPEKKLTDVEKATLQKWILEGAAFPDVDRSNRPEVTEDDVLQEIALDLASINRKKRKSIRYLSLAHLSNNPKITDEKMALYRAGFSKAINSLSHSSDLVLPKVVGRDESKVRKAQVLFRIDFDEYGWTESEQWRPILRAYPYGLDPRSVARNPKAGEWYEQIEENYGKVNFDGIPYLRADWFTATATRPPLYHTIAKIPKTLKEMEARLGIDINKDIISDKARRGGVQKSGVSQQNRLIEFHRTSQGTAWVSYDFFTNSGRGNLTRFPLGPAFAGNNFAEQAFTHDGGEMIFTLPNNLHGYMLIKSTGERLDAGPVEIVYDQRQALGTPQIKNGVSCMLCHNKGTIPFKDTIRDAAAVLNRDARQKVVDLYAEVSEMDRLLEAEKTSYTTALKAVIEPFLLPNGPTEERKSFEDFDEPVSVTTVDYTTDISEDIAAYELGIKPEEFKADVKNNQNLRQLGLGPLLNGERVKRSLWESDGLVLSVFQETASELGTGTPVKP